MWWWTLNTKQWFCICIVIRCVKKCIKFVCGTNSFSISLFLSLDRATVLNGVQSKRNEWKREKKTVDWQTRANLKKTIVQLQCYNTMQIKLVVFFAIILLLHRQNNSICPFQENVCGVCYFRSSFSFIEYIPSHSVWFSVDRLISLQNRIRFVICVIITHHILL